jgi:hypothetical protein
VNRRSVSGVGHLQLPNRPGENPLLEKYVTYSIGSLGNGSNVASAISIVSAAGEDIVSVGVTG